MYLTHLSLCDFRNYSRLELKLERGGAVFVGPNGSGKSNLLEAVYLLCVGRSHRGAPREAMIRWGARAASVRGVFRTREGREVEAVFGFDRTGRLQMVRDGREIRTQREWFGECAAVAFGSTDLELVTGAPSERRRFLDIILAQRDPEYIGALATYNRALASRRKVLAAGGETALLDEYENQMAESGVVLFEKRREICDFCQPIFTEFYARISGGTEEARLEFRPGAGEISYGVSEWRDVFSNMLKNNRKRDAETGHSTYGCHRDSIAFHLDGHPARAFASQGQLRSMAAALRLCAVQCLVSVRGNDMVLLLDDAFTELDEERTARVYPLLAGCGQTFLATPAERVPVAASMRRYRIGGGEVRAI